MWCKDSQVSIKFKFTRCDATKPAAQRAFMAAIIATRRFSRNQKSQILFEVRPGDYCIIDRRQGLQSVLEDGQVLELSGDIDDTAIMAMWVWLTAAKWQLPRAGLVHS